MGSSERERRIPSMRGAKRNVRAPVLSSFARNGSSVRAGIRKPFERGRTARRVSGPPGGSSSERDSRMKERRGWLMNKGVPPLEEKVSSPSPETSDEKPTLKTIVLQGTIPDIVQWTRRIMDEKNTFCGGNDSGSNLLPNHPDNLSARAFARKLHSQYRFRIITNDGKYWKSEVRLWENVCALSARLPCDGKGNIIFDAMRRYPSSALVNYGLRIVFGRQMLIGAQRITRIPLTRNAMALFSPTVSNKKSIKEWFEDDTHVRLQETVIHMSAAAEYILRCAYISKERSEPSRFPWLIDERIYVFYDDRKQMALGFRPWNIVMELSEENASACLEEAISISHEAVIEGARATYKRYGQKSVSGKQRRKIKLAMMRQPLKEILDQLIHRIERAVKDVIGIDLDFDFFRLYATKAIRKVVSIYEDVGNALFMTEGGVPCNDPDRVAKEAMVGAPYAFTPQTPVESGNPCDDLDTSAQAKLNAPYVFTPQTQ